MGWPSHANGYEEFTPPLPPAIAVGAFEEVLHAVLGERDVEAVEDGSQQTSHCPHEDEDEQVVDIPQLVFVLLKRNTVTLYE